MGDEVETIFRWRCPKCGSILEENNQGSLMIAKRMHERVCVTPGDESMGVPEKHI